MSTAPTGSWLVEPVPVVLLRHATRDQASLTGALDEKGLWLWGDGVTEKTLFPFSLFVAAGESRGATFSDDDGVERSCLDLVLGDTMTVIVATFEPDAWLRTLGRYAVVVAPVAD